MFAFNFSSIRDHCGLKGCKIGQDLEMRENRERVGNRLLTFWKTGQIQQHLVNVKRPVFPMRYFDICHAETGYSSRRSTNNHTHRLYGYRLAGAATIQIEFKLECSFSSARRESGSSTALKARENQTRPGRVNARIDARSRSSP